jgi:purine-nucleoside phosphorylase
MSGYYEVLKTALASVKRVTDFKPYAAIVLGSGLGALADELDSFAEISYKDIEGFPVSTVEGHKGRLVFGYIKKTPVVIMQGRVHLYEGYSPLEVTMPVRLMRMLGAEVLLLTNAAGGVNKSYQAGDLMLIRDHISCFVPSPLIGENIDELGTRFPDMSTVYDKELCSLMLSCNSQLKEGVYCQLTGPQYETPTEVKLVRTLGGDAVGMSTACEAIAAKHCGMRVCGVSCITNMAAGVSDKPLSHSEVQETADKTADTFKALVRDFIGRLIV